jgi:hypothetical protein
VWERPYRPEDALHAAAADLELRGRLESAVARRLSKKLAREVTPEDIILDVPEQISFEAVFPVVTEEGFVSYPDSGTVFTPNVVKDFTRTLRRMRLIVDPAIAERIGDTDELMATAYADLTIDTSW